MNCHSAKVIAFLIINKFKLEFANILQGHLCIYVAYKLTDESAFDCRHDHHLYTQAYFIENSIKYTGYFRNFLSLVTQLIHHIFY